MEKTKSGLAQESQQNTTAQWSRLHFDLQTQSGFTLRPSPPSSGDMESARASRSSGSLTSCISQPNLMSGMCRISSPNNGTVRNSIIRMMWSRSRLWNGSAVARLMDARVLLGDIEWAFSSKASLTGRPSCQRRENKVHLVISTARTAEIHHVKVF